jgi:pyruvate formate lyase activating enzyme
MVPASTYLERTGTVFDIQRFSLHDGPGIRTTVFLKGCGLRCFWCHNPEGIRARPEIQFHPERCIGCNECVLVCPEGAHAVEYNTRTFDRSRCLACGQCVQSCYARALELNGTKMTVAQVMSEVLQDRAFYGSSGGGVTLSGGEPLLQRAFAGAILELCQDEGIHTAIETTAHCSWESLAELLAATDLVMMDLKHMDPEKHRAATGVSNERILANARRLMQTGKPILFRVPVVPTVNDTPEEIGAIASFVRHLTDLGPERNDGGRQVSPPAFELLAFHRLAADKYRSLSWDYKASKLEAPTKAKMEQLKQVAISCGITYRE